MPALEVDEYLRTLDHPLAPLAQRLRALILAAHPGVIESIKWNAPNFALADDFATFSLRRPTAVQVILHTGAKPKPEHPLIEVEDPEHLLRRADRNRMVATLTDADGDGADRQEAAFAAIVAAWIAQLR